jgi:hypothetical protein
LQTVIFESLDKPIEARESYAAQLEHVRALETEVANLKAWGADKERHKMEQVAGLRLEHIDAVHLRAQHAILLADQVDVRLAEDDEQVALAGVLEVVPCAGPRSCAP